MFSGGPSSVYLKAHQNQTRRFLKWEFLFWEFATVTNLLLMNFDGKIKRFDNKEYGYADLVLMIIQIFLKVWKRK